MSCPHNEAAAKPLLRDLRKGIAAAVIVAACLIFINFQTALDFKIIAAAIFALLMYFFFFTVGTNSISLRLRTWIEAKPRRIWFFPLLLAILLYSYVFAVNGIPWKWPDADLKKVLFYLAAIPFAVALPVLLFYRYTQPNEKAVNSWDFLLFAIAAGAVGSFRFPFDYIPVTGNHFETASRLVMLLVLVYTTVVVRRLKLVGFSLSFNWRDLLFAIGCWLIMVVLFIGFLYPAGLIEYVGYKNLSFLGFQAGFAYFIGHLFRIAAFEELVFRGIFQNMFAQKVGEFKDITRKRMMLYSVVIATVAAFAATFLIKNAHCRWLPPLAVIVIFAATCLIEKYFKVNKGEYIVLAIISVIFGIVHYRFGEVFMALACLAGWFDGFVYTKTKNVYLAALVHALLNCSAMFLGLHKNL